jgi:hypothetical protein
MTDGWLNRLDMFSMYLCCIHAPRNAGHGAPRHMCQPGRRHSCLATDNLNDSGLEVALASRDGHFSFFIFLLPSPMGHPGVCRALQG